MASKLILKTFMQMQKVAGKNVTQPVANQVENQNTNAAPVTMVKSKNQSNQSSKAGPSGTNNRPPIPQRSAVASNAKPLPRTSTTVASTTKPSQRISARSGSKTRPPQASSISFPTPAGVFTIVPPPLRKNGGGANKQPETTHRSGTDDVNSKGLPFTLIKTKGALYTVCTTNKSSGIYKIYNSRRFGSSPSMSTISISPRTERRQRVRTGVETNYMLRSFCAKDYGLANTRTMEPPISGLNFPLRKHMEKRESISLIRKEPLINLQSDLMTINDDLKKRISLTKQLKRNIPNNSDPLKGWHHPPMNSIHMQTIEEETYPTAELHEKNHHIRVAAKHQQYEKLKNLGLNNSFSTIRLPKKEPSNIQISYLPMPPPLKNDEVILETLSVKHQRKPRAVNDNIKKRTSSSDVNRKSKDQTQAGFSFASDSKQLLQNSQDFAIEQRKKVFAKIIEGHQPKLQTDPVLPEQPPYMSVRHIPLPSTNKIVPDKMAHPRNSHFREPLRQENIESDLKESLLLPPDATLKIREKEKKNVQIKINKQILPTDIIQQVPRYQFVKKVEEIWPKMRTATVTDAPTSHATIQDLKAKNQNVADDKDVEKASWPSLNIDLARQRMQDLVERSELPDSIENKHNTYTEEDSRSIFVQQDVEPQIFKPVSITKIKDMKKKLNVNAIMTKKYALKNASASNTGRKSSASKATISDATLQLKNDKKTSVKLLSRKNPPKKTIKNITVRRTPQQVGENANVERVPKRWTIPKPVSIEIKPFVFNSQFKKQPLQQTRVYQFVGNGKGITEKTSHGEGPQKWPFKKPYKSYINKLSSKQSAKAEAQKFQFKKPDKVELQNFAPKKPDTMAVHKFSLRKSDQAEQKKLSVKNPTKVDIQKFHFKKPDRVEPQKFQFKKPDRVEPQKFVPKNTDKMEVKKFSLRKSDKEQQKLSVKNPDKVEIHRLPFKKPNKGEVQKFSLQKPDEVEMEERHSSSSGLRWKKKTPHISTWPTWSQKTATAKEPTASVEAQQQVVPQHGRERARVERVERAYKSNFRDDRKPQVTRRQLTFDENGDDVPVQAQSYFNTSKFKEQAVSQTATRQFAAKQNGATERPSHSDGTRQLSLEDCKKIHMEDILNSSTRSAWLQKPIQIVSWPTSIPNTDEDVTEKSHSKSGIIGEQSTQNRKRYLNATQNVQKEKKTDKHKSIPNARKTPEKPSLHSTALHSPKLNKIQERVPKSAAPKSMQRVNMDVPPNRTTEASHKLSTQEASQKRASKSQLAKQIPVESKAVSSKKRKQEEELTDPLLGWNKPKRLKMLDENFEFTSCEYSKVDQQSDVMKKAHAGLQRQLKSQYTLAGGNYNMSDNPRMTNQYKKIWDKPLSYITEKENPTMEDDIIEEDYKPFNNEQRKYRNVWKTTMADQSVKKSTAAAAKASSKQPERSATATDTAIKFANTGNDANVAKDANAANPKKKIISRYNRKTYMKGRK